MVALDHFLIVEQIVEKIVGFRLKTPNFAKKMMLNYYIGILKKNYI